MTERTLNTLNSAFVHLKAKYKLSMCFLVSVQFKVCISKHHADCSIRLMAKHQKPHFQLKETVRCSAAGPGLQLRETVFAKRMVTVPFSFGYFLMKPVFPNVKACTWHYLNENG